MSRIEEALKKAANLAQWQTPGTRPVPQESPKPSGDEEPLAQPNNHMLISMLSEQSAVAEEYRKLKEAFIKQSRRDRFNNVVVVTSANPHEGKTITTLNLAISLAQEFDYTVLVVEADLRAPSCLKYLGLTSGLGLSDCLEGRAECSDALIRTGIGRLVILPAGKSVANPVELLSSNRMRQFVQELKHRYPDRFILIDTPPANMFAETRAMASMADSAILVVQEGETSLEDLAEATQALDNKVMGIVYNNASPSPFTKVSSYYYDNYELLDAADQ